MDSCISTSLTWRDIERASSRIWTQVAVSITYYDNRYTKRIFIHIHIYVHVCLCVCLFSCVFVCVCSSMKVYMCARMFMCVRMCECAYIWISVYVRVRIFMCVYVWVYEYMCVWRVAEMSVCVWPIFADVAHFFLKERKLWPCPTCESARENGSNLVWPSSWSLGPWLSGAECKTDSASSDKTKSDVECQSIGC